MVKKELRAQLVWTLT